MHLFDSVSFHHRKHLITTSHLPTNKYHV